MLKIKQDYMNKTRFFILFLCILPYSKHVLSNNLQQTQTTATTISSSTINTSTNTSKNGVENNSSSNANNANTNNTINKNTINKTSNIINKTNNVINRTTIIKQEVSTLVKAQLNAKDGQINKLQNIIESLTKKIDTEKIINVKQEVADYVKKYDELYIQQAKDNKSKKINQTLTNFDMVSAKKLILAGDNNYKKALILQLENKAADAMYYYKQAYESQNSNFTYASAYADILYKQNAFDQAKAIYFKLQQYYENIQNKSNIDDVNQAYVLYNLAKINVQSLEYETAQQQFEASIVIYRKLSQNKAPDYLFMLAKNLNGLALVHSESRRYDIAQRKLKEGIDILNSLIKTKANENNENDDKYAFELAKQLNHVAIIYHNSKNYTEAKKYYEDNLTLRRELVKKNNLSEYTYYLAISLNNIANFHLDIKQYANAKQYFDESLSIQKKLAEENRAAYLPALAEILTSIGSLNAETKHYELSEQQQQESVSIYRELAAQNSFIYTKKLAKSLHNLGYLHYLMGEYDEAEQKYLECVKIGQNLYDQYPKVFKEELVLSLRNLYDLYANKMKLSLKAKDIIIQINKLIN
jgi:tetratricopeptide (TPR) repeat protein